MFKRLFSAIIAMVLISGFAYAQGVTTASISGTVYDSEGLPVVSAKIKVVHEPTGTVSGAISSKKGKYNIVGLRVGGPYIVSVNMTGYDPYQTMIPNLALNQNYNLDINLSQKGYKTDEIQVVGKKNEIISSERTGASQLVNEVDIKNLPTIARSIHDYSRLSPLIVSSTSDGSNVGGRNSKYNNIQVDGAGMSDAFGLSSAGTPGGQAGAEPLSLDVIQEFQVAISPFDVRQGGFTGGLINAITRSGSNYYKGSVYFFGRNQDLVGKSPIESNVINYGTDGKPKDTVKKRLAYPDYKDFTIGGRLGGPIVNNKLFFFANGEYKSRTEPQLIGLHGESGSNVFDVERDTLQKIINIAKQKYNYNPGSYDDYTREVGDMKLFLRLDYNYSDQTRITLRHNFVNANQDNAVSRSRSFFAYDGLEYIFRSMQNQTVLQVNSVLTNSMANEFRLAYTAIRDERDFQSSPFPYVTIEGLGGDARSTVGFGVERFSQANALNQDLVELTNNLNIFEGDHVITIGTSNQFMHFDNLFVQDKFGFYNFKSIADFEAGKASQYAYSYLLDGGKPRANFSYMQLSLYAQDEWNILPGLKLTGGIRYDQFLFLDDPTNNPKFETAFADKGLKTSEMPSPWSISPRIGFNYDVFGNKELQLRGGIGTFTGKTPGVWLSNQYANTGMDYGRVDTRSNVPTFSADPNKQPTPGIDTTLSAIKTSEVNMTDPDFKMPSILRLNLGADYQITDGLVATIELIYGKTLSDVLYQNINLKDSLTNNSRVMAIDGRPMYLRNNVVGKDFTRVIYLTNTDKGDQFSATFQVQKPYGQGFLPNLSANFAYTYSMARDVNSATSSRAISNWQYNHVKDPNDPDLTTSLFAIPHRILANVSYTFEYAGGFQSILGLFYEGRSGSPFSMLYYTNSSFKFDAAKVVDITVKDANNDDIWGNDLIYVPNSLQLKDGVWQDDKFILTNGNSKWGLAPGDSIMIAEAFEKLINSFDELKDQRGKVHERYSLTQPWRHQLDFRFTQVFPSFAGNKVELTFDVLNVLNLINPDWGHSKYVSNNAYSLLQFEGYDKATGKIRASYKPNYRGIEKDDIFETSDFWSRWQMQIGARISF